MLFKSVLAFWLTASHGKKKEGGGGNAKNARYVRRSVFISPKPSTNGPGGLLGQSFGPNILWRTVPETLVSAIAIGGKSYLPLFAAREARAALGRTIFFMLF